MFTFKERGQRGDKYLRCRYLIAHKNIKRALYILIVLLGSLKIFVHGTVEFDHELATELLARNSNKQNHGRFINVRPEVGSLMPTARTFIQEGITTEYATHVIRTVIDNERMYAQLLKSSRIIFDPTTLKENTSLNEKFRQTNAEYRALHNIFSQSHNDLFSVNKSHWRAIDGNISIHPTYVSNTMLEALNEKFPANTNSKITLFFFKQDLPEMQAVPLKNASLSYKSVADKLTHQKILLNNDLFTFTIKHHYEPSGYSLKNYTYFFGNNSFNKDFEQRLSISGLSPKYIYEPHEMSKADIYQNYNANLDLLKRSHISSVTYYGFADFTTTVGDSVIIFSPRTINDHSSVLQNANITSIKGQATLFIKTPTTLQLSRELTTSLLNSMYNATTVPEGSIIQHIHTILKKNIKILDIPKTTFREPFQISKENSFTDLLLELNCPGLSHKRFSINELQASQEHPINSNITDISLETNNSIGGATTIFLEIDPLKKNRQPSLSSTIAKCMSQFAIGFTYESERNIDEVESEFIEEEDSRDHGKNNDIEKIPNEVIVKEINHNDRDLKATICSRTSQIFLTHLPKIKTNTATLSRLIFYNQTSQIITYLQLQYLQTFDIDQTTKYLCIQTVPISYELPQMTVFNTKPSPSTSEINQNSTKSIISHGISKNSSLTQIQKLDSYFFSIVNLSSNHINKSDNIIKTSTLNLDNPYIPISNLEATHIHVNEEDEEIELLYKTFYTTYTYLTTYFSEEGTSISNHTEVFTHINTSTIINGTRKTSLNENIILTSLASHLSLDIGSTSRFILPNHVETHFLNHKSENLPSTTKKDKMVIDLKFSNLNSKISVKTFYTTYFYYTTIFANDGSEILSHTEVYWNFIKPTKSNYINDKSIILCGNENRELNNILQQYTENVNEFISESSKCAWSTPQTMTEIKKNSLINKYKNNSLREQYILNNSYLFSITHIKNESFHDQVNSEINIDDDILTSATLLLQTSFTTYTYYTTIYTDNQMNVISRLETITNMQTETLQPITKTETIQDASLPFTYFTTFTYWTKLAKQGHITTLSREKIVSNILRAPNIIQHISNKTKKSKVLQMSTAKKFFTQNITEILYATQSIQSFVEDPTVVISQIEINEINRNDNITVTENIGNAILSNFFIPTTYYTTYTYYTTSYESESAKTRSRLETVTNIVTPTITTPTAITTSLDVPYIENKSKVLEFKKIFDGDGISTLYFTTQIELLWGNNGEYTELTKTSSSLYINETKKYMLLSSSSANAQKEKIYKTGLVRLIDGTHIGNKTTTLYKSKIIGTLIGQRYAQIIESTSSFIFEKSSTARKVFNPTFPYKNGFEFSQEKLVPVAHNRTLTHFSTDEQHQETDFVESNGFTDNNNMYEEKEEKVTESDTYDDINFNQFRKPAFAPIIPFNKHSRPKFSPKINYLSPSSATIVTHNEFTPTVTATPALKSLRPASYVFSSSVPSRRFEPGFLKNISQAITTSFLFRADSITSQQPSSVSGTLGFRRLTRSSIRPTYLTSLGLNGFNINTFDRMKTSRFYQKRKFNDSRYISFERDELGHNIRDNDSFTLQNNNKYDNSNSIALVSQQNNFFLRNKKLHSLNKNRHLGGTKTFSNSIVQAKNSLKTLSRFITTPITSTITTNTLRPQSSSFQSPFISQRSVNRLSPQRIIFKIEKNQSIMYNALKDKTLEDNFGNDNGNARVSDFYYDDGEGELLEYNDNKDLNRNTHSSRNILIISKRQNVLSRVKRKAENLSINNNHFRNRFGRLGKTTMRISHNFEQAENVEKKDSTISPYIASVGINSNAQNRDKTTRLNAKYQKPMQSTISSSLHRSIRPTRLTAEMRSKFTLRDKDPTPAAKPITKNNQRNRSNFRRRQPLGEDSALSRRSSSANSSRNTEKSRLKSYSRHDLSLPGHNYRNSIVSRPHNHSNGRIRLSSTRESSRNSSSRSRSRGSINNTQNSEFFVLDNKGTITVTQVVPVETSITIVNGKVTKYKKVITAQTNTNILNPSQYTYISNDNGGKTQLIRQDSTVNYAGVTEVTKYVLHEIPTTSITFTPTTIRGRKTSFSHIIASTMYSVESLIMTIQPQIPSNAPLANILLSQLLLGNIGLTSGSNPLLEALGSVGLTPTIGEISSTVTTPTTEYKTHASTYVTTVYDGKSTVLSVTFQGKKILTTVYDTTVKTITATEYITETIITMPSITIPPIVAQVQPVVNSLLLQQILLQQQQQISEKDYLHGVFSTVSSEKHLSELQDLQTINNVRSQAQELINSDNSLNSASDFLDVENFSLQNQKQNYKIGRKKSRKSGKSNKRKSHIVEQSTSQDSTVITLYVSGRRPGEFSTILSTVPIRPERTVYKRHATNSLITKVWGSLDYHNNYDKNIAINYIYGKDLLLINTRATPSLDGIKQENSYTINKIDYIISNVSTEEDLSLYNLHYNNPYTKIKYNSY